MVGLVHRLETQPAIDPARLKTAYDALLQDSEFQAAYERSTSGEEQVRKRLALATARFAGV
jgi:hypothetical protein